MYPKENLSGDGQELPLSDYRHVIQLAKLKAQRKDKETYNTTQQTQSMTML